MVTESMGYGYLFDSFRSRYRLITDAMGGMWILMPDGSLKELQKPIKTWTSTVIGDVTYISFGNLPPAPADYTIEDLRADALKALAPEVRIVAEPIDITEASRTAHRRFCADDPQPERTVRDIREDVYEDYIRTFPRKDIR